MRLIPRLKPWPKRKGLVSKHFPVSPPCFILKAKLFFAGMSATEAVVKAKPKKIEAFFKIITAIITLIFMY